MEDFVGKSREGGKTIERNEALTHVAGMRRACVRRKGSFEELEESATLHAAEYSRLDFLRVAADLKDNRTRHVSARIHRACIELYQD